MGLLLSVTSPLILFLTLSILRNVLSLKASPDVSWPVLMELSTVLPANLAVNESLIVGDPVATFPLPVDEQVSSFASTGAFAMAHEFSTLRLTLALT